MKAIVLTYDKYRALTEHMIFKYQQLWPDHPFYFRIPYQYLKGEDTSKCEYIHCSIDIKETVLTLLRDLDDDEWVYWCIDDKYPISLDLPRINVVMNWVLNSPPDQCSGMLFCRIRSVLNGKALRQDWIGRNVRLRDSFGNTYLLRKNYEQIWLHQFLRVKVIRHLFEKLPDTIENAKVMDSLKSKISLPKSHFLFVTKENLATFGESTSRGELTLNCYESIAENSLALPELALNENKRIVLGEISGKLPLAKISTNK
ncbi:MAG: hypothetical protein KAT07_14275 [Calditrichia bacterium]|nr:hypothetical protein [Calditrichia bacterium]